MKFRKKARGWGSKKCTREEFERLCALHPYYAEHKDDANNWLKTSVLEAWLMFQELPAAEFSGRLLDVGSMFGLFAPAYRDLWGYKEVCLIDYGENETDQPDIERIGERGTRYSFPSVRMNIEKDIFPFHDEYFETVVWKETIE
ncbi:MAG: hypothetical protein AB7T27_12060 [Kiritimatiellia bacterium]